MRKPQVIIIKTKFIFITRSTENIVRQMSLFNQMLNTKKCSWSSVTLIISFISLSEDYNLVTRSIHLDDNWYFELVEPKSISYTYKIRPAKDFGVELVR